MTKKMRMVTIETAICKCLACGYPFDLASGFRGVKPKKDDISVCIECGHVMAFKEDLTTRELTADEQLEIAGDPELIEIQKARDHVMNKKTQ